MSSTMSDPVRPSNDAFEATSARGYRTWCHLNELVRERGSHQVILEGLRKIDNAIPNSPKLPADLATYSMVQGVRLTRATMMWDVLQCGNDPQPLKKDIWLQVAFASPVKVECSLGNNEGLLPELQPGDPKHLEILFAAWAYVLAARWAELLPDAAVVRYTAYEEFSSVHSEVTPANQALATLDNVDDNARQWWQKVLGPGSGWEARLAAADGQGELHSPWSISLDWTRGQERQRAATQTMSATVQSAASYREALGYLQDYTKHHRVNDISRAALAAALFIPVARSEHRDIRLSDACFEGGYLAEQVQDAGPVAFAPTDDLVDRLLLLGCNVFGMNALLNSCFYEPGIFCNLSGPWVQGLMSYMEGCGPATRLSTLMLRDTDLGFFWAGAFLTGAEETCFQQIARATSWNVDLNVGSLTGTSMSFTQEDIAIDSTASSLSRSDECIIRCLYQMNLSAPNFAFPPFGTTALELLDLDVRLPLLEQSSLSTRPRHVAWETKTQGTMTVPLVAVPLREKTGIASQSDIEVPSLSNEARRAAEECSKATTCAALGWLREGPAVGDKSTASYSVVMVEGGITYSMEERDIYEHEWLRGLAT